MATTVSRIAIGLAFLVLAGTAANAQSLAGTYDVIVGGDYVGTATINWDEGNSYEFYMPPPGLEFGQMVVYGGGKKCDWYEDGAGDFHDPEHWYEDEIESSGSIKCGPYGQVTITLSNGVTLKR